MLANRYFQLHSTNRPTDRRLFQYVLYVYLLYGLLTNWRKKRNFVAYCAEMQQTKRGKCCTTSSARALFQGLNWSRVIKLSYSSTHSRLHIYDAHLRELQHLT